MDYDSNTMPPVSHTSSFGNIPPDPPKKKIGAWRIISMVILVLSVMANVFLVLAILAMAAFWTTATSTKTGENVVETTLIPGSRHQKIAAIRVEGILDSRVSEWVRKQFDAAENDSSVRGVIVRIVSPGGGVAASDQIHYAISRYKERTGRPVLAFMQTVAASGGYYSAVACDQIIAEPTAITGSIGVMMSHLVVKDLLEEKLGINPTVIKSGERKDWPSLFSETTDEQKQYLDDRLIQPAYERFVQLVFDGRRDTLSEEQVRQLADGSIFTAPDALAHQLIDDIGYFDQAVETLAERAGLSNPMVVEYRERFSMLSILGAEVGSGLRLDAELLEKLLVPQLMYLWDGRR